MHRGVGALAEKPCKGHTENPTVTSSPRGPQYGGLSGKSVTRVSYQLPSVVGPSLDSRVRACTSKVVHVNESAVRFSYLYLRRPQATQVFVVVLVLRISSAN